MTTKVGKNMHNLRTSLNFTLEDVAKKAGVSRQTIQRYESGVITNIPSDKIEAIADALNTTPTYLMGWETEKPNVEPVSMGTTVRIPVYGRIPAGTPMEAIEEIEDYIDVPVDMEPDSLIALKVVGNSMYPKYIEGDYVIIRRQPDCESGQDCAVRVNGYDTTLKKVIKERDGIMLQPINPEYAPKKYEYTDEFNPVYIIGVVVELRRKV